MVTLIITGIHVQHFVTRFPNGLHVKNLLEWLLNVADLTVFSHHFLKHMDNTTHVFANTTHVFAQKNFEICY